MTLLKEMLLVLDLAQRTGSPDDKTAADRLQRRSVWGSDSVDLAVVGFTKGGQGSAIS
jgi:hypothetical protein